MNVTSEITTVTNFIQVIITDFCWIPLNIRSQTENRAASWLLTLTRYWASLASQRWRREPHLRDHLVILVSLVPIIIIYHWSCVRNFLCHLNLAYICIKLCVKIVKNQLSCFESSEHDILIKLSLKLLYNNIIIFIISSYVCIDRYVYYELEFLILRNPLVIFFDGSGDRWSSKHCVATPNLRAIVKNRHITSLIHTTRLFPFLNCTITLCIPTFFPISDNKDISHLFAYQFLARVCIESTKTSHNYAHCLISNKSICYNKACFLAISCLNIDLN